VAVDRIILLAGWDDPDFVVLKRGLGHGFFKLGKVVVGTISQYGDLFGIFLLVFDMWMMILLLMMSLFALLLSLVFSLMSWLWISSLITHFSCLLLIS
jgi:hypothetical protein